MRRGAKPGKAKVKASLPVARKPAKKEASGRRELEKRLAEALEQQTATSEILRVISSSPDDIQPVFDAIAANAARLCDAVNGLVIRFDGQLLHLAAHHNVDPERLAAVRQAYPRPPSRGALSGRAILTRAVVHVPDVSKDPEYTLPAATTIGYRSVLAVPMMHESIARGTILVARDVVAPFSDTHIALIQTFADQAVIAIENARLFNETKEALEQQTATAEILRVISQSPAEVQPVFDAIVRSAATLCHAPDVIISIADRDALRLVASVGPVAASVRQSQIVRDGGLPLTRGSVSGRAFIDRRTIHVDDVSTMPDDDFPEGKALQRQYGGHGTTLAVPLLREDVALGVITLVRNEISPFTERQVALLEGFANQAVIAIENVRLFTELQEKNRALTQAHAQVTESLEQQTATSEILRTIAQAQTDAQPVFDTIVRSAARLCHASIAGIFLTDGVMLYHPASYGGPPEGGAAFRALFPRPLDTKSAAAVAILSRSVVHVPDIEEPSAFEISHEAGRLLGFRSIVSVPMLREGESVGAISVNRLEPGRFSEGEVELLKTFADQAVIAIENVRLFRELQERTRELTRSVGQLTALGEVGQAVSSSLDLETVLTTIVSRAVQLSGLDGGTVFEYNEASEEFVQRATTGSARGLAGRAAVRKGEGVVGRTAVTFEPVEVWDIRVEGAYESRLREALVEAGVRAIIAVPIIREGRLLGGFAVNRNTPGKFPPETVELLRTFATQSALAIQNARLFREIEDKSRQLEVASRHKSEFLANMSHELRTPLNAVIGFSEVLTERMFGELNEKQDEYLKDIYASGQHLLSLINDILDLSKIEAGRMELEATDFDLPSAIDNALTLVRERASRRGITLGHSVDERLGQIRGDERKVKQVLLNLLSNALKFTPEGGRIDVSAGVHDGVAEVSVKDTGVGIAPEDQEAVFEEFRQVGTADKKVEGTGLGLALSRKFIELHGGRICVKSAVGVGSTFTFTLPLRRGE